MMEIPVMAEIALTKASFCLQLFGIFEANRGSNIRKGGKQKYHPDQKISGVSSPWRRKRRMMPFCTKNGGNNLFR
jgi:hypothetical protein